ncbi:MULTISPECIES: galactonate dehydratase [unclassified Microbacterium]|uniref:galactonate dehydratase n=1 Tax=unclassified Microbacterium TaxID=2609290 RepID=UPI0016051062|nr:MULTISPECIES: galactonate dehydratase [unclassified Microbacterium]QNA93530.1 galactonate dehydratase [Microbacterium sp. Se63.02b]QYM63779.1 galactonate dehydratase [Microbacterium sp. Se5.02b]
MRITDFELFQVGPNWQFLRVGTDAGIVGWGEPIIEGRASTVAAAVSEAFEYLIGLDPLRIEDHWQTLGRSQFYNGGAIAQAALAGIDQALWDIAGKSYGQPVHALLGGHVRDRVRAYAQVHGDTLPELADEAAAAVGRGMTAVKIAPAAGPLDTFASPAQIRDVVDRVSTVRATIGGDVDLAVDFHGKLAPADAIRVLRHLADFGLLFAEEPIAPEHEHALKAVIESTAIPIAAGERRYSRAEFDPLLRAGLGVAQPDPSHAGGISEVRRIGALAEMFGVPLAPHCPLGPIALASALHLDFAVPNFLLQEQLIHSSYGARTGFLSLVEDPAVFEMEDGHFALPLGPGLGVQIDEEAVRHASRSPHDWRIPLLRKPDGSRAPW